MNVIVIKFLLLLTISVQLVRLDVIECDSVVVCWNKSDFTFCSVNNGIIVYDDNYTCPTGYMCSTEDEFEPCQVDPFYSPTTSTLLTERTTLPSTIASTTIPSRTTDELLIITDNETSSTSTLSVSPDTTTSELLSTAEISQSSTLSTSPDTTTSELLSTAEISQSSTLSTSPDTTTSELLSTAATSSTSPDTTTSELLSTSENSSPSTLSTSTDTSTSSTPETTTSSTTTTTVATTTTIPTTTVAPTCKSSSDRFPGPECNEYYVCVNVIIFWWDLQLKTCDNGTGFDTVTKKCSSNVTCPGQNTTVTTPTTTTSPTTTTKTTTTSKATTTTTTTTTTKSTTTPTTTPTITTTPVCSASGNLTGPQCNQYYECIYVMWWWESVLQSCPDGTAYDSNFGNCTETQALNCPLAVTVPNSPIANTTTTASGTESTNCTIAATTATPTCSGPGNFTGPECNQYYECENVMWWWETVLQTCPDNTVFDSTKGICV